MKKNLSFLPLILALSLILVAAVGAQNSTPAVTAEAQPAAGVPSPEILETQNANEDLLILGDTDGKIASSFFCNNCSGSYWTAIHWGMGANCSLAFQDLSSQLDQTATAFCQSIGKDFDCSASVTVTTSCHYANGQYQVDGKLSHGCASFC